MNNICDKIAGQVNNIRIDIADQVRNNIRYHVTFNIYFFIHLRFLNNE